MDIVTIKTKDLSSDYSFDGVTLSVDNLKQIEMYYKIPATLRNVDKKFKTDTFRTVLEAATSNMQLLVDDNNMVQVLDPKSKFMQNDEFNQLLDIAEKEVGSSYNLTKSGFETSATFDVNDKDDDSFVGDLFKRRMKIVRRAEGGLSFNTSVIRLACTNGLEVADKQFTGFIRNASADNVYIRNFYDSVDNFSVKKYFEGVFKKDGKFVPCSVGDLSEMHSCLQGLTDDGVADMLFPMSTIKEFYDAQGIDIDNLARKYLDKLPTGLTYYQALNILTNGAKQMIDDNIDNKVKIARFCSPRRIQQMQDTELHWRGNPTFSQDQISSWMGDLG